MLELSVLGLWPRKGIGFTALGNELRSRFIALLTISLIPVLSLEMELFSISMLGGCLLAACAVALPG